MGVVVSASEGASHARLEEFRSLRREIVVRVIFQNVLLVAGWLLFAGLLTAARWTGRSDLLLVYSVASVSGSAMWAHHGCRTAQIRAYLQSISEPELWGDVRPGWEAWLERSRFRSLLGSRWFVSTKGFLLGSQIVVAGMLALDGGAHGRAGSIVALAGIVATIWLLHEPELSSTMRAGEAQADGERPSCRP